MALIADTNALLPAATAKTRFDGGGAGTYRFVEIAAMLTVAFVVGLQPVSNADVWWHVVRGRAVAEGSTAPSRTLLIAENNRETDWLAGLPVHYAYELFGIGGLSALKLAAALTLLFLLYRVVPSPTGLSRTVIISSTLLAVNTAIAPSATAANLLAVPLLWRLACHSRDGSSGHRLIGIFIVTLVWANLSPLALWSLLVVLAASLSIPAEKRVAVPQRLVVPTTVFVACCMTPRGIVGLWDQLRSIVPTLAVNPGYLAESKWEPLYRTGSVVEISILVVLTLWLLGILVYWRGNPLLILAILLIQLLTWIFKQNFPIAVVLTACLLLTQSAKRAENGSAVDQNSERGSVRWAVLHLIGRTGIGVGWTGIGAAVITFAFGQWPGQITRLGWGLHHALDVRINQRDLDSLRLDGSAHCDGILAAGAIAVARPGTLKVFDVPERALLGDRFREYRQLSMDLRHGRRTSYLRSDGSRGGWWIPLMERKTRLIVVARSRSDMIRAVNATNWKPISLDARALTFALAGDAACTPQIVETLQQQHLLEWGPWVHSPSEDDGASSDWIAWLTGKPTFAVDVEQAEVLRALRLQRGALRIIAAVKRRTTAESACRVFTRCQLELAYEEQLQSGQSSTFRLLVFSAVPAVRRDFKPGELPTYFNGNTVRDVPFANEAIQRRWETTIALYRGGRLDEAVKQIGTESDQTLYGGALLLLEAGHVEAARDRIGSLLRHNPDETLQILGQQILDETHGG